MTDTLETVAPHRNHIKHSHSGLNTFGTCPHKFYRERILRDVVSEPGEAAIWGDTVHKGIEDWLMQSEGTPVPAFIEEYTDLLLKVRSLSGQRFIECQGAVREDWRPCDYTHPTVYFRGKIDLVLDRGKEVLVIDWKTGKSGYGTKNQDAQYAALIFALWPKVETIKTRWVYLAEGKITSAVFTRAQELNLRALVDSPARQVERAAESGVWPRKPSGLCKKYCDVFDCPYNGRSEK